VSSFGGVSLVLLFCSGSCYFYSYRNRLSVGEFFSIASLFCMCKLKSSSTGNFL